MVDGQRLRRLREKMRIENPLLPECMMPDVAEPCKGYTDLLVQLSAAHARIKELEGALAKPKYESGWVIEHRRSLVCEPEYWTGNGWSKDNLRALRYARQIDAEMARNGFDEDDPLPGELPHRVAEHGWG